MKPIYPNRRGRPRKPVRTDGLRYCYHCKQDKPLSEFYPRTASPDGVSAYCKVCEHEKSQQNYRNNLKVNREKRRRWQDTHHDEHLAHARAYQARKRKEREAQAAAHGEKS